MRRAGSPSIVWRALGAKEVGSEMNLYTMMGSANGTQEAATLSTRLAAWHDAMVAHERKIRARTAELCDEECPHAEARMLWMEALEVFGDRAEELTFLRSRATHDWHRRSIVDALFVETNAE